MTHTATVHLDVGVKLHTRIHKAFCGNFSSGKMGIKLGVGFGGVKKLGRTS